MYAIYYDCREREYNDVMIFETLEQAQQKLQEIKQNLLESFKTGYEHDRIIKVADKTYDEHWDEHFENIRDYNIKNGYERIANEKDTSFDVQRLNERYLKDYGEVKVWENDSYYFIKEVKPQEWLMYYDENLED